MGRNTKSKEGIRIMLNSGKSYKEIAKKYKCSYSTISNIKYIKNINRILVIAK